MLLCLFRLELAFVGLGFRFDGHSNCRGRPDRLPVDLLVKIVEALDTYIPEPKRDIDKPFLMPVEDVFSIQGRGTVATGRVERRAEICKDCSYHRR